MKRARLMMVAVLGVIALLLSFAPMPAVTTAPTGVAEAETGSDMPIGTEVVLSNSTVTTYLGKTLNGNNEWQATIGAPRYLDDLTTPIDCRWEYDIDTDEWNSGANLFNATVKDDKVTVEYQGAKMHWQPQLEIGSNQQADNGTALLPVDPINENYFNNTLQWDYGNGISRNLRIIEGMLIEYYTISQLPDDNLTIKTNTEKDTGFVWTRPASAWDNSTSLEPLDIMVDGNSLTLTREVMQNATLPITIDPDTTFTTSASDAFLYRENNWRDSRDVAWFTAHNADFANVVATECDTHSLGVGVDFFVSGTYGYLFQIYRAVVYFDTSGLPDDCNVTAATLKLYKHSLYTEFCPWTLQVQNGTPPYPHYPPDSNGDDYYYARYSGNGGTISSSSMSGTGYRSITLTEDGKSWINKAGTTKFMFRDGTFDIPNGYQGETSGKSNCFCFYAYEKGAGYRPQLVVTYEIPPPLQRYAPVLYFHPNEDYYTDPIDSMLNESNLTLYKSDNDREFVLKNPTTGNLTEYNTTEYYMDMRNAEPGSGRMLPDGRFVKGSAIPPDRSRFTGYPYTVYGRQVNESYEGTDYIVLQYWFFYPYNNWWNCHEGDMEKVQIICNKTTGEPQPQRMTFGQHHGGETVPWNIYYIGLTAETHPLVFVASGSHASYPTPETRLVGVFEDYTSWFGNVSYPNYVSSSEISAPGGYKQPYVLEDISSEPSWTKWLGTWGCFMSGPFGGWGMCGPDSPANVVTNNINIWNDPIAWANDPGSPWNILTATGPVRLHAYDSNGNHTGLNETGGIETEIPGTYFYVPASNQSDELMWIYTEENLTFKLKATGAGECNFTLARYFNDTVTTNYSYIEVTQNTTAKVDTGGGNPLLLMGLDFDSNGVTDEYKFPDSNSTLKGQVSFAGRGTAPNDRWIEPFNVTLFEPGNLSNVLWTGVATTNNTGVFTIDNIPANTTYDIGIKNWTCLSELVTNVTVGVNETTAVDFGTTREGDANNNDVVNGMDFSLLSGAYGSRPTDPNWNANCDFNRDSVVNGMDFSLLSGNYGQCGDLHGV